MPIQPTVPPPKGTPIPPRIPPSSTCRSPCSLLTPVLFLSSPPVHNRIMRLDQHIRQIDAIRHDMGIETEILVSVHFREPNVFGVAKMREHDRLRRQGLSLFGLTLAVHLRRVDPSKAHLHLAKDAGRTRNLEGAGIPVVAGHQFHLFDVVIDGNGVEFPKPHPEVFLNGAKALGLLPNECIVFEDAASGIAAAKAGGFHAFAVGNPNIADLADTYLNDLTEFSLEAYA